MKGKYLNSKEVKKVLDLLNKQWGFSDKLNYVFFQSNKRNIYIVNKEFASLDASKLRINTLGMYFGEITQKGDLRLSIEGAQMIGPNVSKQVLELDDDQVKKWMYGEDVEVADDLAGFHILKHENYFVGCGSCKNGVLVNFVPKNRRIKTLDIPS
ncbi:hypothetical protein COV16_06985 [Candidatus Woesearchaeota archaeon CG10_big_fil_rev_8_21_14_0_10_34_8]|nr:MAG: hypothetical protein COV16_06985 [Candidatus Woesearchaeota archaeon CG10_big_fil_rev_8_21_14_0_10_34_8]